MVSRTSSVSPLCGMYSKSLNTISTHCFFSLKLIAASAISSKQASISELRAIRSYSARRELLFVGTYERFEVVCVPFNVLKTAL